MKPRLTVITGNEHKLREIAHGLPEFEIDHIHLDIEEIQSLDAREILKRKLEEAAKHTSRRPLLVEDVSLTLAHYDHRLPGPLIKWFTQGPDKTTYVLRLLSPDSPREAIGTCMMGLLLENNTMHFVEGVTAGILAHSPRGETRFGFDPIFIPEGDQRTYAEMTPAEKHSYSPRGKALELIRTFLSTNTHE